MARARPKPRARKATPTLPSRGRVALTEDDARVLTSVLREKFGREPYQHQVAGIRAQLEGRNMVIQAATGSGKTAIAAGPHFWPGFQDKITIMVCPLLTLEEEMVSTFRDEFGLSAIALNSANGACNRGTIDDILRGVYKIIILSPEMAQARIFVDRVLRNTRFMRRILALFIDEAHCISHWGANFRKKYGTLGNVIAFLPRSTPIIAVSATMPPRVRRDIYRILGFRKEETSYLNLGNDRPNISLVVRACHHPMNSFADLNFFLPKQPRQPQDIPKTYIYCDSVPLTHEIVDYLGDLLCERAEGLNAQSANPTTAWRELIRPFNASMSPAYRAAAMAAFRRGDVRVLVCTEAAGMGCNILDVDLVVQWKLPTTASNFVQRAGRAARDSHRLGLAVLLVEKSAYSAPSSGGPRIARKRPRARPPTPSQELSSQTASQPAAGPSAGVDRRRVKDYAVAHGSERGGASARDDPPTGEQPSLFPDAPDEGLSAFVQSVTCRRALLAHIFESPELAQPTAACCDICDPSLLHRTRCEAPPQPPKTKALARGEPDVAARRALYGWRETIYARDHAMFEYDETAVLSDALIEDLVSVGHVTEENARRILFSHWPFWDKHAEELIVFATALKIKFTPLLSTKKLKAVPAPSAPPTPEPISRPASAVNPHGTCGTPVPRGPITPVPRWPVTLPALPNPASDNASSRFGTHDTRGPDPGLKRPVSCAALETSLDSRARKHPRMIPPLSYDALIAATSLQAHDTALFSHRPAATTHIHSPWARPPSAQDRQRFASRVQWDDRQAAPTALPSTPVPAYSMPAPRAPDMRSPAVPSHRLSTPELPPPYSLSATPYPPSPFLRPGHTPTAPTSFSQPALASGYWTSNPTSGPRAPLPMPHLSHNHGTMYMHGTRADARAHSVRGYGPYSQSALESGEGSSQETLFGTHGSQLYYSQPHF